MFDIPTTPGRSANRLLFALALSMVLGPTVLKTASAGSLTPQQIQQIRIQERERIKKLMMTAAKDPKMTPKKLFMSLYGPMAQANYRQMSVNMRLANGWYQRGIEAEKNRQAQKAKVYYTVAALFKAYAECNKAIVEAFKKGESGKINENCAKIQQIERKLLEFRGVRFVRTWLTPSEWRTTAPTPQPGQ